VVNVDHRLDVPPGYDAARLTALAAPLDPGYEARALQRAALRLERCFDLGSAEAEAVALRCVLFGRDRRLHETLALMAEPASLRSIVNAVEIEGIDRLESNSRGRLLVTFHYGPYSSLLWLALARAAAAKRIPPVTFLLNRQLDPNLVIPRDRWDVLVAHDVLPSKAFEPFDLARRGISASRELAKTVKNGGSLLIMPDAWFVPVDARTALTCRIGQRIIGFPRGAEWLARRTECEVVAAWIQPDQQGHRIVLEPVSDVSAALAVLGAAVAADPAPWEGWTRDQPFF
jgi:lauroyl/myristoyl acyltransferase